YRSPFSLVLEHFHDVTSSQHVLGCGDKLTIGSACVVLEAVLAVGPIRYQDHHPSSLLDENRMADQLRNVSDVILHCANNFLDVVIGERFTDDHLAHLGTLHCYFSFC